MKNTQNITLSLSKDLLIKVKHMAIDNHTSVSGLLTKTLETLVADQCTYEKAKKHYFNILKQCSDLNNGNDYSWKREDLYER